MTENKPNSVVAQDEWDIVAKDQGHKEGTKGNYTSVSPIDFLITQGLSSADAARIVDVAGCESLEDLKLLRADTSGAALQEVMNQAGLKIVPAEKLRHALDQLKDEVSGDSHHTDNIISEKGKDESNKIPQPVDEVVVICIDRSFSMGTPLDEATLNYVPGALDKRSRMEAVKAMFYGFRDRVQQLDQRHKIGLIQFDNKVEVLLGPPTEDLDKFEAIVDDMSRRGSTAIFSAIVAACEHELSGFATQDFKHVDLRVLVLTDGENNCGASPQQALDAAYEIGAVVDAIIVGDSPDPNLRRVVTATGGEAFQIKSLGEGFELLEAESAVSLRARRGGEAKSEKARGSKPVLLEVQAKELATMAPVATRVADAGPIRVLDIGGSGGAKLLYGIRNTDDTISGAVKKRLMKELAAVAQGDKGDGEGIHFFPSESNILDWRVIIEGPVGSPFEGGAFVLRISIPQDYPFKPPRITFVTPVYHCNVSDSGGICLDILRDQWSPRLSISQVIKAIRLLLAQPNSDDAIRAQIAEQTMAYYKTGGEDTRYVDEARRRTQTEARKSVDEWRLEWTNQDSAM